MKAYFYCLWLSLFFGNLCSAAAELVWEATQIEFKATATQTNQIARFSFKNTGEAPVTITEIKPSCDCTLATTEKKIYQPHEAGEIMVNFIFARRFGMQEKHVSIKTDSSTTPTVLKIKVEIPRLMTITPPILRWKKGESLNAKTVKVQLLDSNPIEITKVVSSIPEFSSSLKPIKPGFEYEVAITPSTTDKAVTGKIQFESSYPIKFSPILVIIR